MHSIAHRDRVQLFQRDVHATKARTFSLSGQGLLKAPII